MTESNTPHNTNWIDAWLETQQGWLGRWQSLAVEQRADAMRVSMDTLRQHLDPQTMSSEALNVVQSFQTLLQSCMAAGGAWAESGTSPPWQAALAAFPLGPAREQQLTWQVYVDALADYQLRLQAVLNAYGRVFAESLQSVPQQVEVRATQGKPVQNFRELYELWIDCGEAAFATLASDATFITTQATFSNALSRLKSAQQALMEQWLKAHDLPTRSELNTVHGKLRELSARVQKLERQLRDGRATDDKLSQTANKKSKSS